MSHDFRRHYDEEGNAIPAKTGAERQKAYEWEQSADHKKRPGWWLSNETIKAVTDRQWSHIPSGGKTKSDRIDAVLRYLLRIAEVVEGKVKETGRMPKEEALALVLEKIAALEVPCIPEPTEEELKAERLEFFKSISPGEQRAYVRLFGNPEY